MGNIQCVAVARHTYYETEVDEKGKVFEPEVDRNIKVKFPEGAFAGKTIVATQVCIVHTIRFRVSYVCKHNLECNIDAVTCNICT